MNYRASGDSNPTVRSAESRWGRKSVELWISTSYDEMTVLEMDPKSARHIGRLLAKHVNFLDPPKKRKSPSAPRASL